MRKSHAYATKWEDRWESSTWRVADFIYAGESYRVSGILSSNGTGIVCLGKHDPSESREERFDWLEREQVSSRTELDERFDEIKRERATFVMKAHL